MNQPIERELKILVSEQIYENIIHSYDFSKPWKQINTYYDTEDGFVKNMNGACRIRTINTKHIFTLKIRTDSITHIELEKEIDTDIFSSIKDKEVLSWLKQYKIPITLHPINNFTTIRQTYDFPNGQLCADKTIYENHIDYELEYEYFHEHDGITVFNKIIKPFGLQYKKNCPSKIARAFNHNL